nr:ABC transporter substrate-binding protein [Marinifaba aquimaris]
MFALLLITSFPSFALNIVFVCPTDEKEPFWKYVRAATTAAAEDLDIQVNYLYSHSYRIIQSEVIETIPTMETKPDYVVFMPYGGSIVKSFNILEKAKIPFVTMERVFDWQALEEVIALPRQKYQYWLGEIYHDNIKASHELTQALIDAAQSKKPEKSLNLIGFNGDYYSESLDRAKGFKKHIFSQNKHNIIRIIPAQWSAEQAQEKFGIIYNKHNDIDIVWSASDKMALGIIEATSAYSNIELNQNMFIGGFDWLPSALKAIEKDQMTASVGGHFLQGALSLLKIYDHEKGQPVFIKGDNKPHIQMSLINKDNISDYQRLFQPEDLKKVDFKQFSLYHNEQKAYQFNADMIVKALSY